MAPLSQTQQWLVNSADHHELNNKRVSALTTAIMAPPDLQGLFLILENLIEILPLAKLICTQAGYDDFTNEVITPTHKTAILLLKQTDKIKKHPLLALVYPQEYQEPRETLRNKFESHPLYSALGHKADNPSLSKRYWHLQAQIFIASHIINDNHPGSLSSLLTSFRGVRYLSEDRYSKQLKEIKQDTTSPVNFIQTITTIRKSSQLAGAIDIIKKSLVGFRKPATKSPEPNKKIPRKSSQTLSNDEDISPVVQWTGTEIISKSSLSDAEAKVYIDAGGIPAELAQPTDYIPVIATNERIYSKEAVHELAFQATQASNAIAIRNQNSSLAWRELNQYDVATLLDYLSGKTKGLDDEGSQQVKLLLTIMFWCGCQVGRALQMSISATSHPRLGAAECIYWCDDIKPYVRLTCPGPELSEKTTGRQYKQAIAVIQNANIPLANIAIATIKDNLTVPTDQYQNMETAIFPNSPSELEQLASETLKLLNEKFGTRLTLGRISKHLLRNLARCDKEDIASATLFFGHKDKEARTRIHYTVVPLVRIENSYKKMCIKNLGELGFKIQFPHPTEVNYNGTAIGTPLCPTADAIRHLVWQLQEAVEGSRSDPDDLDSLAIFHTHYTLYTTMLIAFTTGYRDINDPSFCYDEIDTETNLAIIADKLVGLNKNYLARTVWLTPTCLTQINNYRDHLLAIWGKLGATSQPFFDLYKNHSKDDPPLELFFVGYDFFKAETVRQGLTEQILSDHYDYELRANSNRHYLRNQLTENGCPTEIIDTFMGHCELGQEPWNSFSNLRHLTFKEIMIKHLTPILEKDGWKPIKGYSNDQ